MKVADQICAFGPGPAGVGSALVDVSTADEGISLESLLTLAGVIPDGVDAEGVGPARRVAQTFVDVSAFDISIALKSLFALANEVRRQIATFGVLHATARQLGDLTLVDVCTCQPISLVPVVTGAEEAAECVGAVAEDVTGPVLALVLVGHVAPFAAVPVVAVALRVQTGAVLAGTTRRV